MNETYNHLREVAAMYRGTEDAEQIALDYQIDEDATKISYLYCKNIGLTLTVSDKFFGLTEDDISSYALEELHKAMLHYRPDGGAKLTTLYSRFLQNRLRTETQSLNYDKRKSNSNTESLEGTITESDGGDVRSTGMDGKLGYEEPIFKEIELLMSLSKKEELSDNEYKYCEIIVSEISDITQVRDSEIAKRLDISSAAVHYIKKSLQKKIAIKGNNYLALNI